MYPLADLINENRNIGNSITNILFIVFNLDGLEIYRSYFPFSHAQNFLIGFL